MWYKQCFSFKRRYTSQKEGGHTFFDITVVVSCKCKGYDREYPLLCSPSMCYNLPELVKFQYSKCAKYTLLNKGTSTNHETHWGKKVAN